MKYVIKNGHFEKEFVIIINDISIFIIFSSPFWVIQMSGIEYKEKIPKIIYEIPS